MDFIFGQAKALFDNCTCTMSSYGFASVTAQERLKPYDDNCYVFTNSRVVGDPVPWNGQVREGRCSLVGARRAAWLLAWEGSTVWECSAGWAGADPASEVSEHCTALSCHSMP